jgi:hypothetical protein
MPAITPMLQLDAFKLQLPQLDALRLNATPLKLRYWLLREPHNSIAPRELALLLLLLDQLIIPVLQTIKFSVILRPAKTGAINREYV